MKEFRFIGNQIRGKLEIGLGQKIAILKAMPLQKIQLGVSYYSKEYFRPHYV